MTVRTILVIGAGGLAVGLLLGMTLQGWRLGAQLAEQEAQHAAQMQRIAEEHAAAIAAQQQARQTLQTQLTAIDTQRYQELTHAQENTDRLVADLAAARQRLRVRIDPASCPGLPTTTGASGVDDGAGARADLYPAVAEGIVRVTGRADECRARLTALQEWVRALGEQR